MTAAIIIIGILAVLLIYVTYYYTSQEYYVGTIIQTTSGYDAYNLYHYYFDVQYSIKNKSIGGFTLKTKRIEVPNRIYSTFKVSDNILIKA
jgi:hypothetical protein